MSEMALDIDTGRPYKVHVGTFLLERVGEIARESAGGARAAIVTDSNVGPLYARPVRASLEAAGYGVSLFTFDAGEESKRASTYVAILEFLAESGLTRSDVVIALGGGVTGDMAGFAAATYMRGCPFVQVPTSLLAMVDSSVGGKTAIDLEAGKNLAGAFWQPSAVVADVGCLATLSTEQFADGCGEVVKHAVLADPDLFCELERTPLTLDLLLADVARTSAIIARNIDIKRAVVVSDEREHGARKLLNLGHSIGHAVEAASDFTLGHGNCVSIGLSMILEATAQLGGCDPELPGRIRSLLARHGLATTTRRTAGELYDLALHDKKRTADAIDLVIPHAIGRCSIERTALPQFRDIIERGLEACAPGTGPEAR